MAPRFVHIKNRLNDIAAAPQNVIDLINDRTRPLPVLDARFSEMVNGQWRAITAAKTGKYRPIIVGHFVTAGVVENRLVLYPAGNGLSVEANTALHDAGLLLGNPEVLAQTETIFGPIWVWLAFGETPASATLIGGAIILAAVVSMAASGAGPRSQSRAS